MLFLFLRSIGELDWQFNLEVNFYTYAQGAKIAKYELNFKSFDCKPSSIFINEAFLLVNQR